MSSNKKVVYCLNWSKEDMSAAASREDRMVFKQAIACQAIFFEYDYPANQESIGNMIPVLYWEYHIAVEGIN